MSESNEVKCLRCDVPLDYIGMRVIQYRQQFRSIDEAFNMDEDTDLMVCPKCGHLEYFHGDVGAEMREANISRGQKPTPSGEGEQGEPQPRFLRGYRQPGSKEEYDESKGDYDYRGF